MRNPVESFQKQWPTRSPNRQLHNLLAALVAKDGGEVRLPIDNVLEIEQGETIVLQIDKGDIVLRYSPDNTLMYTTQDTGTIGFDNHTPTDNTRRSHVPSDTELADMESLRNRQSDLRRQAESFRTNPIMGASDLGKAGRKNAQ